MTDNFKSILGVDNLYYAVVSQDDSSAYTVGTPAYLAPLAMIAIKPKVGRKTQYFDNIPMDSLFTEGESEADIEIQGLPLDRKAELLGKVWDAVNGRMYDDGGIPPYIALGFRAMKSDGSYKYYWYLKCQFATPDDEAGTKTDTPDPKPTKLKLTALYTIHLFDVDGVNTASVKKVEGDTSIAAFSSTGWFSSVQIPAPGTPSALTCTPSPADAATNINVASNITLTFNNALAGGAENGIILTTDAGVVKACARTIDAARKVVTLDPTTNMAGSTKYLVVVPGVTDIYGQSLADAVYDFTTA